MKCTHGNATLTMSGSETICAMVVVALAAIYCDAGERKVTEGPSQGAGSTEPTRKKSANEIELEELDRQ